jgi:hypothetical protein
MKPTVLFAALACAMAATAAANPAQQQDPSATSHSGHPQQPGHASMAHEHGNTVPAVSYRELQQTAEQLTAARQATTKYQDVRAAAADGYRAVGPHVPGMGIHYVREGSGGEFSIGEPPILLYERDATAASGLLLVGVSYLVVSPAGADGQPTSSPFPKALASWHKHNNVCVLPDKSASVELTEAQCTTRGGRFTAETSWMVHVWIWKDSPAGVFSPTNPLVK